MPKLPEFRSSDGRIYLANDGGLELYFVGVGSAFAGEAFQSNLIIVKGKTHLMVDLGSKASVALKDSGVGVADIKNLLVTHSHSDHIGGVEEWCLRARYGASLIDGGVPGSYKPNLYTTSDYAHILWDATLRGGLEHSENRLGRRLAFSDYVTIHCGEYVAGFDRPVYALKVGEGADAISLKVMRTNHMPDSSKGWWTAFYSVGVVVDDRFFFTGDTMFDPQLVATFGADVGGIFHDCQDFTGGVHASYEELCTLPTELKRKMILYHLPDGLAQNREPAKDGFVAWARCYRDGSYRF